MRILAVTCIKDEAPFLLEWIAHHQSVGFTDFLILSNDCNDGSDLMLDRLSDLGIIHHLRNAPPYENSIQWSGLKLADKHPVVSQADWIMSLDIDEFVNIHVGNHRVTDLIERLGDADAITLTWRMFGNNDIDAFVDRPICDQFNLAAPRILNWSWQVSMFKTLYRNSGIYRKIGIHRPRSPDKSRLAAARWYDGSGRQLPDKFKTQQVFSPYGRDNYKLAQLNHYALGSKESYIVKSDRGRANHMDETMGLSYWVERNWNLEADQSIDTLRSARMDNLARFMGDDHLADLHNRAVDWRKSRFDALMLLDRFRTLYGQLLMTPPTQAVSDDQARMLLGYARQANP